MRAKPSIPLGNGITRLKTEVKLDHFTVTFILFSVAKRNILNKDY